MKIIGPNDIAMKKLKEGPCKTCSGYGEVFDEDGNATTCPTCNGSGWINSDGKPSVPLLMCLAILVATIIYLALN